MHALQWVLRGSPSTFLFGCKVLQWVLMSHVRHTHACMQVGVGACKGGQIQGEHVTVQSSAQACYSMHAGSTAELQDCVATGAHPCMAPCNAYCLAVEEAPRTCGSCKPL